MSYSVYLANTNQRLVFTRLATIEYLPADHLFPTALTGSRVLRTNQHGRAQGDSTQHLRRSVEALSMAHPSSIIPVKVTPPFTTALRNALMLQPKDIGEVLVDEIKVRIA